MSTVKSPTSGIGRVLALAALTLTSAAAGFLTVNVTDTTPPDSVGTISRTDRAYTIDLDQGDTLTFTQGPDQDAGTPHLVVYDPDDRWQDAFSLGPNKEASFMADKNGSWVFVPWTRTGDTVDIDIDQPEAQATATRILEPIPLRVATQTVLERTAQPAHATFTFELDRRPALAYLTVDGNAESINVSLFSPTGPVFDQTASTLSGDGIHPAAGGEAILSAERLVPGTYRLEMDAERLSGRVVLAYASYERVEQPPRLANASLPGLQAQGVPVAAATQGDAFRVDAQQADRLRFVGAHDTLARAYVYTSTHNITSIVQLGPSNQATFDWEQDEANASLEQATIRINPDETYTVWIQNLAGHGDQVYAVLPDLRTATPATPVPVLTSVVPLTSTEAGLSDSTQLHTHLEGGLLDIGLWINDTASQDRVVQVTGPRGLIFEHRQETTVNGTAMDPDHLERPSHFSAGTFRIDVSSGNRVEGEMVLRLHHYAP